MCDSGAPGDSRRSGCGVTLRLDNRASGVKAESRAVDLPSDEGRIRQAGLRFRQRDALLSQHRRLFRDEGSQQVRRSVLPSWHVHQFSENRLIDTKSYLLLLRKVPMVQ